MNDDVAGVGAVRIRVIGLVQGVGFRYFARREAERIGVGGFARNLPDGSVEAVAEGRRAALGEFVGRMKIGPPSALVERVEVDDSIEPRGYERFEIRF